MMGRLAGKLESPHLPGDQGQLVFVSRRREVGVQTLVKRSGSVGYLSLKFLVWRDLEESAGSQTQRAHGEEEEKPPATSNKF